MGLITLKDSVKVSGIGLHSGKPCSVTLNPGLPDHGIMFRLGDGDPFPASVDRVADSHLATTLEAPDGARVMTVEHLMAALSGYGVTSCLIDVDGPEIPAMDGSAMEFVDAIESVGVAETDWTGFSRRILKPIIFADGDRRAALLPSDGAGLELSITINFDHPMIGRQSFEGVLDRPSFLNQIGPARTFGFARHEAALHAEGRALGANQSNTLVIEGEELGEGQTLRWADEFVRHKALDVIGDLALAGHTLQGRYEAHKPGHALNHQLLRALAEDKSAWEYAEPK